MASLETRYMNLALKNPLVVASSGLTKSVDKMQACEDAGAAAVVVKSLFEEALANEDWGIAASTGYHAEAYDYLRSELELQYGPRDYCRLIENAKKKLGIPVIASVNCVSAKWWTSYAVQLQSAGADALELNVFNTAFDPQVSGAEVEKIYFDILQSVKSQLHIPVAMKISDQFASLPHLAASLSQKGLDALVLFNRFTEPDIDIKALKLKTTFFFTRKEDYHASLRWAAILADKVRCDLAATSGVHDADSFIKLLLAGARVVEIASVLYKNGLGQISKILEGLDTWMEEHHFKTVADFNGLLSFSRSKTPDLWLRAQFLDKIQGWE